MFAPSLPPFVPTLVAFLLVILLSTFLILAPLPIRSRPLDHDDDTRRPPVVALVRMVLPFPLLYASASGRFTIDSLSVHTCVENLHVGGQQGCRRIVCLPKLETS
jgi:hypothetical protein